MGELVNANGLPAYASGASDADRAVIVLQEAFGVNDHIRDVTDRFAAHGYYALAPILFHRDGSPEVPYDDFTQALALLGTLTKENIASDLDAAARHLKSLGFARENIGVVGYCMGGALALFADVLGLVGASVTFYGGGVASGRFGLEPLVDLAPQLSAPWLGLYGDLDQGIPVEQVEALREAASTASTTTEIIRYADADHGFHCDQRPAVYNAEAARDAAERAYAFLEAHLSAR